MRKLIVFIMMIVWVVPTQADLISMGSVDETFFQEGFDRKTWSAEITPGEAFYDVDPGGSNFESGGVGDFTSFVIDITDNELVAAVSDTVAVLGSTKVGPVQEFNTIWVGLRSRVSAEVFVGHDFNGASFPDSLSQTGPGFTGFRVQDQSGGSFGNIQIDGLAMLSGANFDDFDLIYFGSQEPVYVVPEQSTSTLLTGAIIFFAVLYRKRR